MQTKSDTKLRTTLRDRVVPTSQIASSTQIPRSEMCSKSEVITYQLPELVERFEDKLKLNNAEARLLFVDLLQFLFVCGSNVGRGPLAPPPEIDTAWHEFLMFTSQYADFCYKYFGRFIHHVPQNRAQKTLKRGFRRAARATELARAEFGQLSSNWDIVELSDCEQCCDGDC
jgi:hypothetical protein